MAKTPFLLRGHARADLVAIRKYTIETWGNDQWLSYKKILLQKLQSLADDPEIGIQLKDVADNAYRFPLKDQVVYYLKRKSDVVIVGILSNSMAPEQHVLRQQDLTQD
ncbi:MAG: type II toxin-antitoxin system RelE/ParE family toxin [Gammaproteobacteria bacterium]|nr:type II toxin-antitoxin system RelE/ParE family toxin [Gammaproteobacteria bacterium]MBU2058582.1 type II toxin-antitoxin system RelE/ParE family toxin [Gammaproteobacteria bacterium]MBU2173534.1 type II toxin-antitoxin system RelE/ParE family toxin [Gammaproteobacteria bacterium]MBU2246488.1 type II toxin-antitoxin system RelE/ParE family toxin [Gammaproteobacteria bacterium]MBU2344836.1 type II toxin-antitoxin system RelE/ParE family toxin [Gammaproteobacteria bacterium]